MIKIKQSDCLLVIDAQKDFFEGGSLAVPNSNRIIAPLNKVTKIFTEANGAIVCTQDWHPYATKHFNEWPPHCIKYTMGARFPDSLTAPDHATIFRKGDDPVNGAYSAFEAFTYTERGDYSPEETLPPKRLRSVPLNDYFYERGVPRVFVGGLATDYCVKASVMDSLTHGFNTYLIADCVAAVNLKQTDGANAINDMVRAGAHTVGSDDLVVDPDQSIENTITNPKRNYGLPKDSNTL